ncbi:MAG: hypothetical protein IJV27_12780 [Prevotella sp.]|nr:hypothetical protein [Prevotella sp.]
MKFLFKSVDFCIFLVTEALSSIASIRFLQTAFSTPYGKYEYVAWHHLLAIGLFISSTTFQLIAFRN